MFLSILLRNLMSTSNFVDMNDFKAKILAAISSALGTYGSAASTVPSIWIVRNTDTEPPSGLKRRGLECLLFPPVPDAIPLHNSAMLQKRWRIRLIQHDRASSILDGYQQLLKTYPQLKTEGWLEQTTELDEQINLSLYGHEIWR
jgi:hypothetical protein